MPRIDAHHHLWDITRRPQPWMDGSWADPLRRTFTLADLAPHLAEHRIDGTVLVQTSSSYEETLELCEEPDPPVHLVCGWLDLTASALDAAALRRTPARLGALRHQAEGEPDPRWLVRPDVLRALGLAGECGLVYDLLVTPRELPAAIAAARAVPHTRFVLDHAGKPQIAAGEWQPWADLVAELARLPNVSCKLSGLVTQADWEHWRPADVLPYARHVIDVFGPGRILFGSDWPVCTLAAGYGQVVELAEEAVADLTAAEREAFFGGNARRIYLPD
ncbi:amidohydrolase family protein [Streptomyces phytophilus]|uniref:amidohydrolase family protein n=1 Tax=Streptomyces phytophilus TaxID=722715 RepID=UPI0015F1129A|nr:amidohydrolase family protein [Streptomyces phytophilus]